MTTPVWLVTGAGTGFGHAISKEALNRGYHVIATARNTSKVSGLVEAGATALELDVCAPEDVIEAKIKEAHAIYGRLTHILNVAGYVLGGSIEEASEKEVFDQFNTNVFGTVKICRAVLPYLRQQNYGYIANFGSMVSWIGNPATSFYDASKWAVSGFTEGLAAEVAGFDIRVVCIEPGMFRTAFLNDGKRIGAKKRLDGVYKAVDEIRAFLDASDNKQPGDVVKGAAVVVDLLTASGVAEGRELPVRLLLGRDAIDVVRNKCETTLKLIKDWESVSASTDHVV